MVRHRWRPCFLTSHQAFRRDIERFIQAVAQIEAGDSSRAQEVRGEWDASYRQALHGHHMMEDTRIFPDLKSKHPELEAAIDKLTRQRNSTEFPTPVDDAMATMYAEGFAWSTQGIAHEVMEEIRKLLPEILLSKFPAAQEEFAARCKRVWGTYTVGSTTTSVPDEY